MTAVDKRCLRDLFAPPVHFQRSINLRYDLGVAEYISAYVPTPHAATALTGVLSTSEGGMHQRAHVLIGAYGAGKSLFAVALAALLSRDEATVPALETMQRRLSAISPEVARITSEYRAAGTRLLPIVLSGEEGDLAVALARALQRAVERAELVGLYPPTAFQAALETISRWQVEHPDAYDRLQDAIKKRRGLTLARLQRGLRGFSVDSLEHFRDLYAQVTAGATFAPHPEHQIADALSATAKALRPHGYDGVVIIHDEFGRFLDAHVGQPFGANAQLLQDLAERANRSDDGQLHLVLITHKGLRQYAAGLPDEMQREWARIEQRFQSLDLSGDPDVAYRLIASALEPTDRITWQRLRDCHALAFDTLVTETMQSGLFDGLDREGLRHLVIEGIYPLHPATAYCLPRLSEQVAQNERTLFTFLSSEDDFALPLFLADMEVGGDELPLVRVDQLYDYFAAAMKADTGPGGVHGIWLSAEAALRKFGADDEACAALKALAVLLVVGGQTTPSTELLTFALGVPAEPVLDRLKARKAVIYRRTEGYWQFVEGSDLDIEHEIADRIGKIALTPLQLRQHVERAAPVRHQPARRYNDKYAMTRFFHSMYRTPAELSTVGQEWDGLLRQLDYADGLLVYVLATNEHEMIQARAALARQTHPRVVFLMALAPLTIGEPLRELLALDDLDSDPMIKDADERIGKELSYFKQEAMIRLERALTSLVDPRRGGRLWIGGAEYADPIASPGMLSRVLSEVLERSFDRTPVISNEGLNRRSPTSQQTRAAEKVIDAFLREPLLPNLGLTGYGPDVAVMRTVLMNTGVFQDADGPEPSLGAPTTESRMTAVWAAMEAAIAEAEERSVSFEKVVDLLQSPPYGLRRGVLPILLAAFLRRYLDRATVTQGNEVASPLVGSTFTSICTHPDQYTLRLEPMDTRRDIILRCVEERVTCFVQPEERRNQPLRYLSLGLLRWLQQLPPYARGTRQLSPEAVRFRRSIQIATTQPAQSLLIELPDLLLTDIGESEIETFVRVALLRLMTELEGAYNNLIMRIGETVVATFGGQGEAAEARAALLAWLHAMGDRTGTQVTTHLFGDVFVDALVAVADADVPPDEDFVECLGRRMIGLPLHDWGDHTEAQFQARLIAARDRIATELVERQGNTDDMFDGIVHLPGGESVQFQFKQAEISVHAKNLLTNLKNTIEITGRALSVDERRRIGLEVLRHVLERRG